MLYISNDYLLSLIGTRAEGVDLDYKEEGYSISLSKQDKQDPAKKAKVDRKKQDLIIDLTAMANANGVKLAVIITGVCETSTGIQKVGLTVYEDDSRYQELLRDVVKPQLRFQYREIQDTDGHTFGFFVIKENIERPYCLDDDSNLLGNKAGKIVVRRGSSTAIVNDPREWQKWIEEDKAASKATSPSPNIKVKAEKVGVVTQVAHINELNF